MILIVGLGNHGREYAKNRHNIGFFCIDYLAKKASISIKKNQCQALTGSGVIENKAVILAKPKTYVNNSGLAVAALLKKHNIPRENLIVIYDDMDLPLGKMRIRKGGSAGGHNGIKSIIASIGSQDFKRIKIGIGRPDDESDRDGKILTVVNHVLSDFSSNERTAINTAVEQVAAAIESILTEDITSAMNKFN
jgi:peptidyl-tRNA hydrolase, PTH1 family